MYISIYRTDFNEHSTIGRLGINGVFECFTLEDKVRQVDGHPVSSWKVQGQTAIPKGKYNVVLSMSNRFKKVLPLIVGVEGFDGVRIHPGNTDKDTEGCILVGKRYDGETLLESRLAFEPLFEKISNAINSGDTVELEIS